VKTGPLEQPKRVDTALLELLQARDGLLTYVLLTDGNRLPVFDIAWGYDMSDEHAHVTSNCSPSVEGRPLDFFSTHQVTGLQDEDGTPLVVP